MIYVSIDYTTVSTIATPKADVEIALGEGETIETYIKGAYEAVQLKVNGTVVAENATITAGTIDVASYLGYGTNKVTIVVNGVESNAVEFSKARPDPEGTAYKTEYTAALSAAGSWENKVSTITIDGGAELGAKVVAITLTVKGTIDENYTGA